MKRLSTKTILFFLFILSFISVKGQGTDNGMVGIGQWRMHLPYNKAVSVTEGNDKIYCASRYGLFSYNKNDGALERYSMVNGLSDFEIAEIRYNAAVGVLVIAYENSNIDLLYDDHSIVNISDIKRTNIVGNKNINDIFFKDHFAYLSCGFGIIVLDIVRREIKDTYYIGPNGAAINVNGLTSDGTYFFAATGNGIYKALVNDPNIFNYTHWSKDSTLPAPNGNYSSITFFSNKVFAVQTDSRGSNDTIMIYDESTAAWSGDTNHMNDDMKVYAYQGHLIVKLSYTIEAYDAAMQRTHRMDNNYFPRTQPLDGFVGADNVFWIADYYNGLLRFTLPYEMTKLTPNGPASPAVWAMQCLNDDLWVASGTLSGTTAIGDSKFGSYLFSGGEWNTFDRTNDPGYDTLQWPQVVCVAVDPNDSKHAFVGTWGSGVLEYRDHGVTQVYNRSNSTLQVISLSSPGFTPIQIGGMVFDSNNNLWVTNTLNSTPLSVRKADGNWQSFVLPSFFANTFIYSIVVDDFNQKWMVSRGRGIGVFNENDIGNPNDNSFRLLVDSAGNGHLPSYNIFAMAKDKDGAIWLGCDQGVAVIYNPGNVFTGGNYDAQKILIQQDGHTQYLLETETVLSMAVDGANRKWFGTVGGGVFLMSADGTKQLLHFTVDNSPLLSNYVNSIAINDQTGEVFFGTEKGIVSYRSDATAGGETCEGYLVFPNPVKHDYFGPIAIKGLVNNADVKITDVTGALVYHTKANGGEAIWYGTNFKGERVHTGVYFVYASNDDGSATCVTKMLFTH